jgi:hypothetical protein
MTADRLTEIRAALHKLVLVRDELKDPEAIGDWCNGLTVASCGLMHEENAMQREVKGDKRKYDSITTSYIEH